MPDLELEPLYDALAGARLRLRVSAPPMPEGERLQASARVYSSGSRVGEWTDDDLQPGPAITVLENEGTYRIEICLAFPDPEHPAVTVHIDLLDPAGGVIASDFAQIDAQAAPFTVRARAIVDDY